MQKFISTLLLVLVFIVSKGQNIGIGTNNPQPSAALDITDTSKGILIPRLTIAQRNNIQNPSEGLMIYQTDSTKGYWYWDGSTWQNNINKSALNSILTQQNGMPQGINVGDILYWNGTSWVPVPLVADNTNTGGNVFDSSDNSVAGNGLNNGVGNGNGLGLALCNGVPTWGGCPLTIITKSISQIDYTSAISGGNITTSNNIYILASGVCYGTSPNPTVSGNKTTDGNGGNFSSTISGLLPNTTYYVRAYGTQGFGTTYGNQMSFTTLPLTIPTLATNVAENISNFSAVSGGAISSDGGASITAKGVCWSTSANPTINNNFTNDGTGNGTYASNMTGLSPNTTYYVRAYATNSVGTAYGSQITFTTFSIALATITTNIVVGVSDSTALSGGNIINDGGSNIVFKGICWDTIPNPTITNKIAIYTGLSDTFYVCNLTGLAFGKTYYVRAFAINSFGTTYGNEIVFTIPERLPKLVTIIASNITDSSANSGGNIIIDGGSPVVIRGICWDTLPSPTISNQKTNDGGGLGSFSATIGGLTLGKTYYVRAYAINGVGTGYGNEISFIASSYDILPSVLIGEKIWSTKNLDVETYRNGDTIPMVNDPNEWVNLSTGAWCWYNNDSANGAIYGRLYNWYAVNDPRGIAPRGWHVATDEEWKTMTKHLDSSVDTTSLYGWSGTNVASQLRSTTGWAGSGLRTNSSGFNALPGGYVFYLGSFYGIFEEGYWWSSSEFGSTIAWMRHLHCNMESIFKEINDKRSGLSVRVVRDY